MNPVQKAIRLNPHHFGHYHWVPFMNCYRQGEHDLTLTEARRFNAPHFFWDPINPTAVLGQMGRQTEARKAVDEFLPLVPDFKNRGLGLIRRMVYLDENVDLMLDGLRKARLKL